ncbi:MAG TPA: hypothetical protein ENK99_07815 [Campylobacterales bacterium]|nr:hypothetical protein [Campylobacterales bacterium]HHH51708.1 hypothetical protein [Campylobacterales bacterium]
MQIFNHSWINSPKFYKIESIKDIENTPPNSIVSLSPLPYSIDIAKYCQKNLVPFIIEVNSIKDSIFANILGAKYIISSPNLAKEIMPIAQNYLFDTQVLATISKEDEIEDMARVGVDGVMLIT